ncbi:MAG: hypothetical protein ACE5KC_00940 [Candidatus Bathyarchaeia archaeon]
MRLKTKRLVLATLFGAVLFLSKTVVPSPMDKMFLVVHALLLALGALLLQKMGATYVALMGGVLTALLRTALAPFTFAFALLYGLFIDGFFFIFKVDTAGSDVKTSRLVASMTLSTALVGLISYYSTVFLFGLLQRNLVLEVSILVIGTLNGILAGYLTSAVWKRFLKNVKL